jgi:hypothetical protein
MSDDRRKTDVLQQVATITIALTLLLLSGIAVAVIIGKQEEEDRLEVTKMHYTKLIRNSEDACETRTNRIMERLDNYVYTTDIRIRELERQVSSDNKNK